MAFNFLSKIFHEVEHVRDDIVSDAEKLVSKIAINKLANQTQPRPRPFSLWSEITKPAGDENQGPVSDYTSWPSLTDRTFSGRHLPPCSEEHLSNLPVDERYQDPDNLGDITRLFKRNKQKDSTRSTVTFPFFAQWFTDSFLRVDPTDRRKNTSNHEIDLCQIYGLKEETARILRTASNGKLKSQIIGGEEYLPHLYEVDNSNSYSVKAEFSELPYILDNRLDGILSRFPEDRKANIYATGLERGNSTIGYTAISTLFLREHNRICDELSGQNPTWNDERIFQTARMINIVLLLKIVVEDYIVHVAGNIIPFRVDNSYPEKENWYRTNWISIEFDLLYRWHSLIPDTLSLDGKNVAGKDFMLNNKLLESMGVGSLLKQSSIQPSGRIGLGNTPDFLLSAEYQSIKMCRDFRLKGYNDYREQFKLDRLETFDQLTSDESLQKNLQDLYGIIDNVDFFVGIFAEDANSPALFGELLTSMVASDAFTQALTNPLLSQHVFNKDTFTEYGLDLVEQTNRLQHLVDRNVSGGSNLDISMTLKS